MGICWRPKSAPQIAWRWASFQKNWRVQARFLLGPAGSGKTHRCVAEARAELLRSPAGPPLIFLAPKQATFQIERQLLTGQPTPCPSSEGNQKRSASCPAPLLGGGGGELVPIGSPGVLLHQDLCGYSRLQILSFERLAAFVFEQLALPLPDLLSEEGRVMVLRALLARHHAELKVFRASARLTGFAAQLSSVLRELQCSRISAATLHALAEKIPVAGRLNDKLHDLALLLGRYELWLAERRSQGRHMDDANRLLDLATEALKQGGPAGGRTNPDSEQSRAGVKTNLRIGALWLDGFAEMTPQETALVAALVPHCEQATLAFCLDGEPRGEVSWLSPWTVVGRTFAQCREAVAQAMNSAPVIEVLPRELACSRFGVAPQLLALEQAWASGFGGNQRDGRPVENTPPSESQPASAAVIRLVACPNAEAEAAFAAREIWKLVQSGGRFRDCAILVRSLDEYHDVLRRVLDRYEIPFFLDRREAVAHHPLAELTRYALRTVAFDWRQEDWFGALKTGLAGGLDAEVDWLENEALKRGWVGEVWRRSLNVADDAQLSQRLEAIRQRVMPAFERLASALKTWELRPGGTQLAEAIRRLWLDLNVESQLEQWLEAAERLSVHGAAHGTVWTQLNEWLDNLSLAFADEAMPLREWLPVVEAGLSGMTVGVIPPSLDQVLVGSVDRSRNPDLQTVFVLGVNEGVFPAPPAPPVLLTDSDRLEIEAHGLRLGATQRQQLGHERYFGYIAFTRPRRNLVVTWAAAEEDGSELNPSSFVTTLKRAVPSVVEEIWCEPHWTQAAHRVELPRHILAACSRERESAAPEPGIGALTALPEFAPLIQRWERARTAVAAAHLSPEVAGRLYGDALNSSVSALEDFVSCPFRYVAARALRAQERDEFVVDARQKGSFQHAVLQRFHERLQAGQRRWREVSPAEARRMVREIAGELAHSFENGLMVASAARRFTAETLIGNLEQLVTALVGWAGHYTFDPRAVEVSFGLEDAALPAWEVPLARGRVLRLRGRIDRVDLCPTPDGGAWVVICDYKSSGKEMDPVKIEAGLELQLLSYLAALTRMPEARAWLGAAPLQPAGLFYIPLRGRPGPGKTRADAAVTEAEAALIFQHRGCFDGALIRQFDDRGVSKGEQFRFKLKQDGALAAKGNDARPPGQFPELVAETEGKLRSLAERIVNGEAAVDPYRLKQQTACDYCVYRAVCRFDPWTMPFRRLGSAAEEQE